MQIYTATIKIFYNFYFKINNTISIMFKKYIMFKKLPYIEQFKTIQKYNLNMSLKYVRI